MAKQKRRPLFFTIDHGNSVNKGTQTQIHDIAQQYVDHESTFQHQILKSDLIKVFGLTLTIIVIFTAIAWTNNKINWIEQTSQKITKILIRNF